MEQRSVSTSLFRRSYLMLGFIAVAFVYLAFRILLLQTRDYERYQKEVIKQMTTESVIPAGRGDIYDTNGVLLATDITVYRVFISPKDIDSAIKGIKNSEGEYVKKPRPGLDVTIANGLSELLGADYNKIIEKTKKVHRLDETIAKNVENDDIKLVRKFISENKLENLIHIEATPKRFYHYDSLASTVLGFTGAENSGLYGLELKYNEELSGTNGVYITARDSYGNEMPTEYESYIEAEDGYDITTTLDMFIQYELENQLRATLADNGADERVCGIVMDVKTGGILAMSTIPDFNCNDPWTLDEYFLDILDAKNLTEGSDEYNAEKRNLQMVSWSNKATTTTYMPGSTFKVITTAMCLEEKVVKVGENFVCTGAYFVPGYSKPIHCHKRTGHGAETFTRALQQSCNPVMMTIALRLGSTKFYDYFCAFGLMERTGIDLPGEQKSVFHELKNFNQVELATAAFGQNFEVTPIQQLRAIAAVANGGYLVTPHLVREMSDSDGNVVYSYNDEEITRQVISTDVCTTVTGILEEGVSGDGGAKNAYVAGYRIAAKTGTTEKITKQLQNPGKTYRVGSCIAYAPADDPQVAVLIMVDEPNKGSVYGSIVAAPYVANVMRSILPYMGIEAVYTEKELENLTKNLPNYVGWSVEDAEKSMGYLGIDYEVVGDGEKIVKMAPAGGSGVRKDGKVYLYAGDIEKRDTVTVPDVMGQSATLANMMIINSKLNINITGTTNYETGAGAVVVSQSPAAGESVPKGTLVTV
ncbi:MAG: penicillin-binding transpeptidase domain-containing protein, partial [Clostridia bacterium]|nr:penicillin-binding transpeptidase domain-containing protein [Clostridia bacterium]